MPCKWCGGSGHPEDNCPTRNLVRYLLDEELEPNAKLPDAVSAMDAEELLSKSEEELHQEAKAVHMMVQANKKPKGRKT